MEKNKIKSGWSNTIITGTDYYPTILELTKNEQKPDQHLDGIGFAKITIWEKQKNKKDPFFGILQGQDLKVQVT